MVTDEQLITRLHAAMEAATGDMFPSPGLLDGITPSHRRHMRRPSPGSVFAGLAAAAALAVGVLAIALLGRAHHVLPQAPSGPAPAVPSASRPTSLAELRSQLAVLRRPQRAADKIPSWGIAAEQRQNCSNCLNLPALLPAQTRLLTTIRLSRSNAPGGRVEHVYLVAGTVSRRWQTGLVSGWHQSASNGRGIHLSLVGLTTEHSAEAQPMDTLLNYTARPMPAQALTPQDVMITSAQTIGIVPDGVTRVRWELANPGQKKPITVYPRVRGNVAVAPWTPAPRSTALIDEQWLVGATWYGPRGQVVATFGISLKQLDQETSLSALPKP